MTDLDRQGRYCPSLSAPTPGGVSAGKLGKCVTALRPRFRPVRCFSSLPGFTRDVSAHESAAVRRHHAPGATDWVESICGLCFRLGRVGGLPVAAGFDAYVRIVPNRLANQTTFCR